ncbi:DNA-binding transcriptional regulator, MerR family [Alkalispirochaeta americana]|uniref:DNA-binding transcriptional regulator, MerR family n=1 Tax=Alkalispirochaeta americana TaxID=159291 RepID=A0A1N6T3J0_9SPIO|nr:MerR family transcriptional regulator [Alkalispirochaeta americana]SIQ47676.1 DNA-binding transcriptional regulator, MerR family [Alkalispirochaeta americana]
MKKEYRIGEICALYRIGPDSLRYYERKGLISPKRRENGYRVYTLDDIWRLNIIKDLRKLDFSVDQIKGYLQKRSIGTTIDLMRQELDLIEREIMPLAALRDRLSERIQVLERFSTEAVREEISLQELPDRPVLFLEDTLSTDQEVDLAFRTLQGQDDETLFLFANNDMGVVVPEEGLRQGVYTRYQKAFFFVDSRDFPRAGTIPGGTYAILVYRGSYRKSPDCFERILKFMGDRDLEIGGSALEIYRLDIHGTSREEEFITEIQIPVREK